MSEKCMDRLVTNLNLLVRVQGITQTELARRARVPQTTLNRVFNYQEHKGGITVNTLDSLAQGLRVSLSDLLGCNEEQLLVTPSESPRLIARQLSRLAEDFLLSD